MATKRADRLAMERASMLSQYRDLEPSWSWTHEDGSDARVYEKNDKVYLIAFAGKAGRPAKHIIYRAARISSAIEDGIAFIRGRNAHHAFIASQRAKGPTDTAREVAAIRDALKAKCPTLSVRIGKGTAYGWVNISGSGSDYGEFTDIERASLKSVGLNAGGNFAVISPNSRAFWLKKLTGQGDGKRCIICGDPADRPYGCACDLTHFVCANHEPVDCATINRASH